MSLAQPLLQITGRDISKDTEFTSHQKREWHIADEQTEILVNAVLIEHLPTAITVDMLKSETDKDAELVQLREDILVRKFPTVSKLSYKKLFHEFTVVNNVIVRGNRVLVPPSLQADVIGLAHEGHMGIDKTLNHPLTTASWMKPWKSWRLNRPKTEFNARRIGQLSRQSTFMSEVNQ